MIKWLMRRDHKSQQLALYCSASVFALLGVLIGLDSSLSAGAIPLAVAAALVVWAASLAPPRRGAS